MALNMLSGVLVPFVMAVLIGLMLEPIIDLQVRRWNLPRPLAIGGTGVLCTLLLFGVGVIVASSISEFSANSPAYLKRAEEIADRFRESLDPDRLKANVEESRNEESTEEKTAATAPQTKSRDKPSPLRFLRDKTEEFVKGSAVPLANVFGQSVMVLIFVMFLVFGHDSARAPPVGVWSEVEVQVKHFILTKVLLSVATGVLVTISLWILGVEFAVAFGFFAFVLNFIPSVGSVISTALPLLVVVLSPDPSWLDVVLVLAIPGSIQFVIGNVIEPRIMGNSLDLHPIAILLSLTFWALLWGIPGMLLATPMTSIVKIILQRLPYTRPIADLMAGRLEALEELFPSQEDRDHADQESSGTGEERRRSVAEPRTTPRLANRPTRFAAENYAPNTRDPAPPPTGSGTPSGDRSNRPAVA
jgi:AI-2 transport protein TqsA